MIRRGSKGYVPVWIATNIQILISITVTLFLVCQVLGSSSIHSAAESLHFIMKTIISDKLLISWCSSLFLVFYYSYSAVSLPCYEIIQTELISMLSYNSSLDHNIQELSSFYLSHTVVALHVHKQI